MKNRNSGFAVLVILAILFLVLAFGGTAPAESDEAPVVVGILHWEGFPQADMMKHSFEMALADINAAGGVNGRPLALVYADDGGAPKTGEAAVDRLVEKEEAVMLVGGYASSNTIEMARRADKRDTPFLVCTAADDRITQRNLVNVFRLNPPASEYTAGMEDFLLNRVKPESMAIVYENSPYGTGGALRMMWFCRENDIDVRRVIPYHRERAGADYFAHLLGPIKTPPPDVVYMVSYLKDGAALVKQIRAMGMPSLLCGGAGGFTHPAFYADAGEPAEGLVTATLWSPAAGYAGAEDYVRRYQEARGKAPDYHGAEAYSALLVAADALRRATAHTPEAIRAALGKTNMETPFGRVAFYHYGNSARQNSVPTLVSQIQNGTYRCIWPADLATAEFAPLGP